MSAGVAWSSTTSPTATGWLERSLAMKATSASRAETATIRSRLPWKTTSVTFASPSETEPASGASVMCSGRIASDTSKPGSPAPASDAADLGVDPDLVQAEVQHLAGEQRGFAHEGGAEARGRPRIDPFRRALVLDAAVIHHDDVVGERHRLLLVVRHMHERRADTVLQRLELVLHGPPQLEVEGAQRLVEQQYRGIDRQRPGERHALALPARQLRAACLPAGIRQPHHGQRLASPWRAHWRGRTPRMPQADSRRSSPTLRCGHSA